MSQTRISYYTHASQVSVQQNDWPAFEEKYRAWRPGFAGPFDRSVAGGASASLVNVVTPPLQRGWFVYFVERYALLEIWTAGIRIFSRALDCSSLLSVQEDSNHGVAHLVAFGWDLDQNRLSMGVTSTVSGRGESVFGEWVVPDLENILVHPNEIYIGNVPYQYAGGTITMCSIQGRVFPLEGKFITREYLSQGELARLSGKLEAKLEGRSA